MFSKNSPETKPTYLSEQEDLIFSFKNENEITSTEPEKAMQSPAGGMRREGWRA